MKILFVQKNFHPNSAGQYNGLLRRTHEVRAVMQYSGGPKSARTLTEVEPTIVSYGALSMRLFKSDKKRLDRLGWPRIGQLLEIFADFRPDVVVLRELRAVSLMAGFIAKFFGSRVVLTWDKPKTRTKWPIKSWLLGPFLPRRKIHMGHIGNIGSDVELGGWLGRSRLLPYPVDVPQAQSVSLRSVGNLEERVRIVSIGALDNPRKRMWWVSEAIAILDLSDRVEITYIGLGNEESFGLKKIREVEEFRGLPQSVVLLDVPPDQVLSCLPRFDLFVLPAEREPFGAVVAEAMASGLPVICSSSCGARVCFSNGDSGLVFDSDSLLDLAAKIKSLIEHPEWRAQMARRAHAEAQDLLTPQRWAEGFEDFVTDRSLRSA